MQTPQHSTAPLAEQWMAEPVYLVEFVLGSNVKDTRGCWESDLVPIKEAAVKL